MAFIYPTVNMPAVWLVLMVVLLVVEGVVPGLVSIWFALGALGARLSAIVGAPLWLQVVRFLLISIVIRVLPQVETYIVENARNMNIYVEFESLDDVGDIISRIKSQDVQIYDVEIDHGREEKLRNPNAVFSIRLNHKQMHTQVLAAISELESVRTIDEI